MTQPTADQHNRYLTTVVLDSNRKQVSITNPAGQTLRSELTRHYDEILAILDGIWTHPDTKVVSV